MEPIMMNDIHRTFAQHGLVRAQEGKVLGGVASGLGRRIGIDPWPSRLLFVLVLLLLPGSQLLVYPALWILMPSEAKAAALGAHAAPPVTPTA
jgi:phage shock protein PspC (stress-responsive transcriptional regulator)